jgi:membrane-associated phospholipid phosphatase
MSFFKALIKNLPQNFIACFRPAVLLWYALAAAFTYVLVMSGTDWSYFEASRGALLQSITLYAAIGGFFVPIIVPVALYAWGEWGRRPELMKAGTAAGQAVILAWVISSLFKAFTGRIQPEFLTQTSYTDISHGFHFGFWQHGIFWGWPSSHAAVSCALAAVLVIYFRQNRLAQLLVILYALFIAVGVSISIHWLSDAVAGVIVGTLIGVTVAQTLKKSF